MLLNLKALVVVLAAALVVFALAKPVWLRFTDESDFNRRRNVRFNSRSRLQRERPSRHGSSRRHYKQTTISFPADCMSHRTSARGSTLALLTAG